MTVSTGKEVPNHGEYQIQSGNGDVQHNQEEDSLTAVAL
jgi:hypothetical protein